MILSAKATVAFDGAQYEIKGTGNGPIAAFIQGMRDTFDLKFQSQGLY